MRCYFASEVTNFVSAVRSFASLQDFDLVRSSIHQRGHVISHLGIEYFLHIPGNIKGSDVASVFKDSFDQISDLDAVRICLLLLLEIGFMGRQPRFVIDEELLRLVEDLDSWNTFPWGSYIWNWTYPQLAGALQTRRGLHLSNLETKVAKYTLVGFIWAFKVMLVCSFHT